MKIICSKKVEVITPDEVLESFFDYLEDSQLGDALGNFSDGLATFFKKRGLQSDCEENKDWWDEQYYFARRRLEKTLFRQMRKILLSKMK